VHHEGYIVPNVDVQPEDISVVLISEAAPADRADYYYAPGNPLFGQTTVQAFRDAGADVRSVKDLHRMGVYLTTAVKCGKTGYGIGKGTVVECFRLLEQEIALFP
jgi:uracil-DNA glycosylase